MQLSRALIDTLVENGVETLFGIPGKQTLPLNRAISNREDIDFVVARHESAVSHEAWGYAETSGQPAGTVVIPGPGDMLAMNGLKNALNDCTPLVHIAVETEPQLRGGDAIHETPPDTYDNVVKENILVARPDGAIPHLERAVRIAQTPPKGPVRVGVPRNFLTQEVPPVYSDPVTLDAPPDVSDSRIDAAMEVLGEATQPVVLAGGGVRASGAGSELVSVAERLGAPIVTTYKGKGTVSDYHDLVAGTLSGSGAPELLDCLRGDALLAVGTDFDAVATRSWTVELPEDIVHITLSPDDLGTGYEPTVGIVGDASETLAALEDRLADTPGGDGVERASAVREATRQRLEPLLGDEPPLTSVRALRAVRETIPRETIVTVDAGGFRVWALNVFEAAGPRAYVNPGSWASMGTGLPSGIGAQLANPDQDVVTLTGDGGLMMCLHELHTAVAEEIPLTVVVFNNSDYAIISDAAAQEFEMPDQAYGWGDDPLDFTTIAAGMGLSATRAETPTEIEEALATARGSSEPELIEIPIDPSEPQASNWMSD